MQKVDILLDKSEGLFPRPLDLVEFDLQNDTFPFQKNPNWLLPTLILRILSALIILARCFATASPILDDHKEPDRHAVFVVAFFILILMYMSKYSKLSKRSHIFPIKAAWIASRYSSCLQGL